MGPQYLIDSNVIIDFLAERLPEPGMMRVSTAIDEAFHLSFVNQIEVLAYPFESEVERVKTEDFVRQATVFGISEALIERTIVIRRDYKIKLPDALIAATALVNGLSLLTRNERDFGK